MGDPYYSHNLNFPYLFGCVGFVCIDFSGTSDPIESTATSQNITFANQNSATRTT